MSRAASQITTPQHRRARRSLRALLAAVLTAAGVWAPVAERPAGADLGGLRLVGTVPDTVNHLAGDVYGAYFVDPSNRLLWRFYKIPDPVTGTKMLWKATSLDPDGNGRFQDAFDVLIPPGVLPGLVQTKGDKPRLDVDVAGEEPVAAVDASGSRLFYSAGGAIYEVDYAPDTKAWSLSKFVAPPNPGTVSENDLFLPSGLSNPTGNGTFVPATGMHYTEIGNQPWLFLNGDFDVDAGDATRGAWISGWDARPGNGPPGAALYTPELRQKWFYPLRTCRNLGRGPGTEVQSPVFVSGKWLYTFCDGSTDGSALGVIRVELSTTTGIVPGTLSPTGVEEFFPGVTGIDVNAWGDPVQERMYIVGRNVVAGGRSVLVFDGRASDGAGAYIGAFSVALQRQPAAALGGVDPVTGRWYFQSEEGSWVQEGRLRRVAQATRYLSAINGGLLAFFPQRPVKIDPSTPGRGARVIVATRGEACAASGSDECLAVYQDEIPASLQESSIGEFTLNVPETEGLVGVYAGSASGFGMRARVTRGLSTLWPSSVPGLQLETDPPNDPQSFNWYITDPFFYHGGECGAVDRELTFGRVLETKLSGGLSKRDAGALALAVDPDIHVPSAADDTKMRDVTANPDPCTRHLFERLTGPNCYEKPDDPNAPADHKPQCDSEAGYQQFAGPFCAEAQKDPRWQQFVEHFGNQCDHSLNTEAAGQPWPYRAALCAGDSAPSPEQSDPAASPARGHASVTCKATATEPNVGATSHVQLTPPEVPAAVTVGEVETTTNLVRRPAEDGKPGKGLEATATSIVRGINVLGVIHIAELRVTATASAEGYAESEKNTTARHTHTREIRGVTINGSPLCAQDCDEATVLREANRVINTYGWIRLADPESDFTEGTVKGTLAKVQKDLLQQDADRIMNRDFAKEWVGLEVGIYRDAQRRGSGRWIFELGGVFTQTQFTVIRGLSALRDLDLLSDIAGDGGEVPSLASAGTPAVAAIMSDDVTYAVAVKSDDTGLGGGQPSEGLFDQIAEGFKKSVRMALVLAALWTLVYGPVYLARRRNLLKEVASL